jgi:biopolymer transport protein ExbB
MNNDHANTIDAQLLDLMLRAGSRWVLWLLLALSLAAIAVMLDRLWFFIQEKTPRDQLKNMLDTLRIKGPAAALKTISGAKSMEAAVARTCLEHADDGVGAVEEHKAATLEHERLRYERRIAFLGTLGNNAPFVGLFGTVLGIIRAVKDMSASGQGSQAVMAGIAESLVATGVGLMVALPAVAVYNLCIRKVETATAGAEATAHQIVGYLKTDRSAAANPSKEKAA